MLSLGKVHKWPLPSLIRICENGKWKIISLFLKLLKFPKLSGNKNVTREENSCSPN